MHARTLPNPEALGLEMEEGAVNRPTNPPLAFPRPGIGLARIWQINSPYHTNFSKFITSSSVDTQIPLAGKVALATVGAGLFARILMMYFSASVIKASIFTAGKSICCGKKTTIP